MIFFICASKTMRELAKVVPITLGRTVDQLISVIVVVVRAAPDIPEMSVPGVGYSFKPKGLAFVTPLYPV